MGDKKNNTVKKITYIVHYIAKNESLSEILKSKIKLPIKCMTE